MAELSNMFRYHPPAGDQANRYQELRDAGHKFAVSILVLTPPSADQTAAIRKVREAVMIANAAIAINEKSEPGTDERSK